LTFFGVAGLYVLLYADFLAITQLLIYVGGILVLILFGVMLTTRVMDVDIKTSTVQTFPAIVLAAAVAGTLVGAFWTTSWRGITLEENPAATGKTLGELLMTSFVLPFEVASVVLLVAILGAAMIARREKKQ
jgi:NADH-quinone oxidoreductase subunit J